MKKWFFVAFIVSLMLGGCKKEESKPVIRKTSLKEKLVIQDKELMNWEKILATETYHTRLQGYPSPFEPFFKEKKVSRTSFRPLSPLERWSLKELKLTGIVRKDSRKWALIEDPSGKGYFVSEGTRIGSNGGYIAKIGQDYILVKEKIVDFLGQERVREVKISLRPTEETYVTP